MKRFAKFFLIFVLIFGLVVPDIALSATSTAEPLASSAYSAKKQKDRNKQRDSKKKNKVNGEIINSTGVALEGEFPFMVALVDGDDDFASQFCGGAILSAWVVGTAAHCLEDGPANLRVIVGSVDLLNPENQSIRVASYEMHSSYNSKTVNYDFAKLYLAEPIDIARFPPAVLPTTSDMSLASPGSILYVLGWGDTTNGNGVYPNLLQKGSGSVVSDKSAKKQYELKSKSKKKKGKKGRKNSKSDYVPSINLALSNSQSITCYGDSGGPAFAYRNDGTPVIFGWVSWGYTCGGKKPGVFADITAAYAFYGP